MVANLIRFSVFLSKRRAIYYALITHYNTMKKIYLLWVLCAYIFAGCGGGATKSEEHNHDHEAHEHEEGHDHEHEGHDHEHEGDEHEGHEHGNEAAAGVHSNEIIFKE